MHFSTCKSMISWHTYINYIIIAFLNICKKKFSLSTGKFYVLYQIDHRIWMQVSPASVRWPMIPIICPFTDTDSIIQLSIISFSSSDSLTVECIPSVRQIEACLLFLFISKKPPLHDFFCTSHHHSPFHEFSLQLLRGFYLPANLSSISHTPSIYITPRARSYNPYPGRTLPGFSSQR